MSILDKMNNDMRTNANTLESEKDNRQVFISINDLIPSKKNKEILIVDDGLKETIRDDGLLTPLLVMRNGNDKYEIISGNRRYTSIKSLMKDDPSFKYKWKNKALRDPIKDGIPCNVVESLSKDDKTLMIIGANKVRDYDKLEQYRSVLELRDVYNSLKDKGKIKYGEGRIVDWLAARLPLSSRTISDILSDNWLINSKNYSSVVDCGSFANYTKSNSLKSKKPLKVQNTSKKFDDPGILPIDKEMRKLESIEKYYEKFNSSNFSNDDYQDLRNYAITVISQIMDAFDIYGKELH